MTAPAAAVCQHCKTKPVRQWIKPIVLGATTVQVTRCACDVAFCPHVGCDRSLVDVPMFASRCPKCRGYLKVRERF